MSKIVSIATGLPEFEHLQDDILSFADQVFCSTETESRKLKFLYRHSGINTRYSVLPDYHLPLEKREFYPPNQELEPFPNLEKRMEYYQQNAAPLSVNTINKCIKDKISATEITHLITVSCTGLSAPGLDLEIMEILGLPNSIFRTSVNFMGCYAAIHALKIADSICTSEPDAQVVIVCTEFCTLHFQKEKTPDNITSTLLFADGCAAVLMQSDNTAFPGFKIRSFFSDVAFNGKRDMSWKVSSKGFLMTLTGYVPELLKANFRELVEKALSKSILSIQEVDYWCIHPGGKKILESIGQSLGLTESSFSFSYDVLRDFGNMSSPTILFVLKKIWEDIETNQIKTKQRIFGAAFGPGITTETFTLEYAESSE